MMNIIVLSPIDLAIAALLVITTALLSWILRFGISLRLIIASLRTALQLLLLGLILKTLFTTIYYEWLAIMAVVMLLAASREVVSRQKMKFSGMWGFGLGMISMCISSFSITIMALIVIIQVDPWYTPQYAIPLLGMLLGNTMNGIAIGLDRLTITASDLRSTVETRLMLGEPWNQAIGDIRKESFRSGMIPIINSMSAAGLVSLPGMMTGQILGGNPPFEAVKYQILIMFLIAAGTGFGTITAVWLASRRLFDERQRLRLDRIQVK
jgi:putative ABC transport system permease protein